MITYKEETTSKSLNTLYILLLVTSITGIWTTLPFTNNTVHLFHLVLIIYGYQLSKNKDLVLDRIQGVSQVKPYLVFFFIWYIYMVVSIFWIESLLFYITNLLIYTIMFSFIYIIVVKNQDEETLIKTIKIIGILFAISLIIGFIEGSLGIKIFGSPFMRKDFSQYAPSYLETFMGTPTTFFVNPNNYATFLVFCISFLLAYSLKEGTNTRKRIVYLVYFLALIVLHLTNSRGNFVSLGIAGLVYGFIGLYKKKFKELFKVGIITLLVFAIVLTPYVLDSIDSVFYLKKVFAVDDSVKWRLNVINNSFDVIKKHPLGYGTGNGQVQVAKQLNKDYLNLHNWFLEVLMDFGVIFFLAYVVFYIRLLVDLFKIGLHGKTGRLRGIGTGCFLALVGFTIAMASPSTVIYFYPLWILKAISIATININKNIRPNGIEEQSII